MELKIVIFEKPKTKKNMDFDTYAHAHIVLEMFPERNTFKIIKNRFDRFESLYNITDEMCMDSFVDFLFDVRLNNEST